MQRHDFNKGWSFCKADSGGVSIVDVPHDAMIHETRDPSSAGGSAHAFFPGGLYTYEKAFYVPEAWRRQTVIFEFEGVYRNSKVLINGHEAGGRPYGYLNFFVQADDYLAYGQENTIKVIVDNQDLPNSRWYTGSGIYRPVHLLTGSRTHIGPNGIKVTTISTEPAVIRVETKSNGGDARVTVRDDGQVIAAATGSAVELTLANARLWSDESPYVYQCEVELLEDGTVVDRDQVSFGVRQISWSEKGLFVNGKETLLRGGCVHHDNGILGACAYREAEERRVRILKETGYNAIRSSHNPASRAMLEACDRLGVYMIDETWDMWYIRKSKHDYALQFMDNYREDIRLLVDRNYNHPSVIMYSVGNELTEPYQAKGIELTREMAALFRKLDPGRAVTGGINLMIINLASKGKGIYDEEKGGRKNQDKQQKTGSLFFNMITSMVGTGMNKAANSDSADRTTSPCLDALDIAGYNYASGRYPLEKEKHPGRVIYGSETFPKSIAANWAMVKKFPYLVGDFMWTAWDYLGEAGIGAWSYRKEDAGFEKSYPWLLAGSGAIDILGRVGAQAQYARVVWGLADKPYIGVRPVNHPGQRVFKSAWRWTNALDSWSWRNCDGNLALIEIYSAADAIELLINEKSLGRKKLKNFKAQFKAKYSQGSIRAVAYDASGRVTGEHSLHSATGRSNLIVQPEKTTVSPGEIVFVNVAVVGENGIVEANDDRKLQIGVEGGKLLAFGSANPCTSDSYDTAFCETYFGQAMAVVCADQSGEINVRVKGDNLDEAFSAIKVASAGAPLWLQNGSRL